MSPPETQTLLPLRIKTEDEAAEIFVLDGNLQMAARGVGAVDAMLLEGIYKIKIRAGLDAEEHLLVHRSPGTDQTYPLISFSSPAPLDHTREQTLEQAEAAKRQSRLVHGHKGKGSSIFVFARDWVQDGETAFDPETNAAVGLQLENSSGELVVDIETESVRQTQGAPWAACTVELNPGLYQLSVTLSNGEVFAQSLTACPAWQTQVFLLQRKDYRRTPGEQRANLGSAAVLMARGIGFEPNRKDMRLVELARQGLMNRRPVLSQDMREMLRQKHESPMLGILGGHLLLQEAQPDLELLKVVVQNLRGLLSMSHPDVEALALAAELDKGFVFAIPPMLRRSWKCVVDASARHAGLVPPGSPASQVFWRLTNQDPWLVWRRHFAEGEEDLVENFAGLLKELFQRQGDLKDVASSISKQLKEELEARSPGLVGRLVRRFAYAMGRSVRKAPVSARPSDLIPDPVMENLVTRLGIPRSSVESILNERAGPLNFG